MKRLLVLLCVSALCLCLVGCGGAGNADSSGSGGGAAPEQAEPTLEQLELTWNGNTMGIDQVTDNQESINKPNNIEIEGRLVKVCFYFISGAGDGFVSETYFDDFEANPIVLHDADGNTYEYLGAISDIEFDGDFASDGFAMAEFQKRFSISFDIPEDVTLEELILDVGEGQEIALMEYTSRAYAADIKKDDE